MLSAAVWIIICLSANRDQIKLIGYSFFEVKFCPHFSNNLNLILPPINFRSLMNYQIELVINSDIFLFNNGKFVILDYLILNVRTSFVGIY